MYKEGVSPQPESTLEPTESSQKPLVTIASSSISSHALQTPRIISILLALSLLPQTAPIMLSPSTLTQTLRTHLHPFSSSPSTSPSTLDSTAYTSFPAFKWNRRASLFNSLRLPVLSIPSTPKLKPRALKHEPSLMSLETDGTAQWATGRPPTPYPRGFDEDNDEAGVRPTGSLRGQIWRGEQARGRTLLRTTSGLRDGSPRRSGRIAFLV